MTTGERIREIRKSMGLTQKQLGNKVGIAEQTIGQYERGTLNPKIETLVRIAAALDVNPAEIDESLIINLGSDAMFEIGGEMIRVPGGTPEAFVLSNMDRMTDEAKKKVVAYTEDIASNPKNLRKRNRWQTEEENK